MRSTKWISKIAIGLFLGTLTLSGCSSTDPSTVSEGSNSGSIDSTAIEATPPARTLTVAYWDMLLLGRFSIVKASLVAGKSS